MIATVHNMIMAQSQYPAAHVVMLDMAGNEYSANPRDYWELGTDDVIRDAEGEALTLARWVPGHYDTVEWWTPVERGVPDVR